MAKSEHPFDQIIKEKLNNFSDRSTPDWNYMQQKIEEEAANNVFDQKIKNLLDPVQVDSSKIQWEQFAARRKQQTERQIKIVQARIIESALFLFLLWTLDHIGLTKILPQNLQNINTEVLIAQLSGKTESTWSFDFIKKRGASHSLNGEIEFIDNGKGSSKSGFERKRINSNLSLTEDRLFKKLEKPARQKFQLNTSFRSGTTKLKNVTSEHTDVTLKNIWTDHKTNKAIISSPSNMANSIQDDNTIILNPSNTANPIQYNQIAQLEILKSPVIIENQSLSEEELPLYSNKILNVIKPQSTSANYINVHSGLLVNTVQSPSFIDNGTHFNYQVRPGLQANASVFIQSNKWAVESGIIYQQISYEPNMSETLGSFEKGYYKILFHKIDAQLISLPVLLHRTFIQKNHWGLSLKAGLSISASLKNKFQLDTMSLSNRPNSIAIIYASSDHSTLATRVGNPSNQGLLDGGNFGTNSYANLITGLRYHHHINRRLQFYTEIEFSKMLGQIGFGPNGDRFLSTNFNTGLSFKL